MIAASCSPQKVVITDGNPELVSNILRNIALNQDSGVLELGVAEAKELLWGDHWLLEDRFDVILGSDCFFEVSLHAALLDTIHSHLAQDGEAIFFAPRRHGSFDGYVETARTRGFKVEVRERYDKKVWERHERNLGKEGYEVEVHYPVLVRLVRQAR